MSAALQPGQIVEVKHCCVLGDQIGLNLFHWRCDGPFLAGPQDSDLMNDQFTQGVLSYPPLLSTAAGYYGVSVRILGAPGYLPQTVGLGTPQAGTVTGIAMPHQTAGIAAKRSAFAGRSQRGRVYIPFPGGADNVAPGTPSGSYQGRIGLNMSILNTAYTLVAGGGNVNLIPVIYHRAGGGYTDIQGWNGKLKWATQRRRGEYGRPNSLPW